VHKELLYVLAQGVPLYGSSSMGALRAAELAAFGMRGRGDVFARYASGELVDDDEVALAYHQEDGRYRAMSEPMVNIRATVEGAVAAGVISMEIGATALATAKGLEYPQRHQAAVLQRMRADYVDEPAVAALARFWQDHAVDVKADDARALLRELSGGTEAPPRAPALVRTENIDSLVERKRRIHVNGWEVALAEIADHVQLHHPERDAITTAALNRGLALTPATLLDVHPTVSEIRCEAELWRREHGLTGDDDLAAWLGRNHLSAAEFDSLVAERGQMPGVVPVVAGHQRCSWRHGAAARPAALVRHVRGMGGFHRGDRALADSAELRAPDETRRLSERDVSSLAAMHERDTGVRVTVADDTGFLSSEEHAHALARSAAARLELRHRLRQAADAVHGRGSC
jgi:hypothetical protein